ncbi:MAG TPA: CBO0543 family protein [Bacilli bacterium]|nr:CBO0543 family protein [Bacilli bacterium]
MKFDLVVLVFFSLLSVGLLIWTGVKGRESLRALYALAISADFYSVLSNTIGISLGYWDHHTRFLPKVFETSIVYDLLFFPALIVLYVTYMPDEWGRKLLYSLLWVLGVCILEHLVEHYTGVLDYHNGWNIYKTAGLYFLTYWLFYGLYVWLARSPVRRS